jgi:UDP-N-acetylmuramate--alanine ligase
MKTQKKNIYFIGIKGVAMTALATYFVEKGYSVAGSDTSEKFATDRVLNKYKIKVFKGFSEKNIEKKYEFVVVTGAHGGMTNIEAIKSKEMGIKTYMHGEMLGKVMSSYKGISVAGCHGKTTTSAFIASILSHKGLDPSYAVGSATINDLGPAGHFGRGKYFVAEADEYVTCPKTCAKPRFLWQYPEILCMTNIDYDHPDVYRDIDQIKNEFLKFTENITKNGVLILCRDDKNIQSIIPKIGKKMITYGFSPDSDFRITSSYSGNGACFMKVSAKNINLGEFMIRISGKHNMLNALAASIAANYAGISWSEIKENMKFFTGTKRRFEKISEVKNVLLYDDYAHHPKEIAATISSVRAWYPDYRLILIFQPHTYSRTKALLSEFADSLALSDLAIIPNIYPSAREIVDNSINSKHIVEKILKKKKNSVYLPDMNDVLNYLQKIIQDKDLIMTMGAGDIFLWHDNIIKMLENKLGKHKSKSK